jgi:hypothetical protein
VPAVECFEPAREHVDGPDEQHGVGILRLDNHLIEVDPSLEHRLELFESQRREGVVVGANRRRRDEVLRLLAQKIQLLTT